MATWCSGAGGLVAERRSTVRGDEGGLVEAGGAVGPPRSRRRRARDRCPRASRRSTGRRRRVATCARGCATAASRPTAPTAAPWRFRAADLDLADHVNNAVYWQALEEELRRRRRARAASTPRSSTARPADVGEAAILRDGHMLWIADADGEVLASWPLRLDQRSERN